MAGLVVMLILIAADVAALKLLSPALLALTVQVPVVIALTTPVKAFTLQIADVLVAKLTVPVPLPPIMVSVAVLPDTRLDVLLETVSVF